MEDFAQNAAYTLIPMIGYKINVHYVGVFAKTVSTTIGLQINAQMQIIQKNLENLLKEQTHANGMKNNRL